MPTQEQMRKERFEELLQYVQKKQVRTFDPILRVVTVTYPWLSAATAREYAAAVMRCLEAEQKEIKGDV